MRALSCKTTQRPHRLLTSHAHMPLHQIRIRNSPTNATDFSKGNKHCDLACHEYQCPEMQPFIRRYTIGKDNVFIYMLWSFDAPNDCLSEYMWTALDIAKTCKSSYAMCCPHTSCSECTDHHGPCDMAMHGVMVKSADQYAQHTCCHLVYTLKNTVVP